MIQVRVKLFAAARQLAGSETITVDVTEPATAAALRDAMANQIPSLKDLLQYAHFAVNAEYVNSNAVFPPDTEVACIPPVSGG